MPKEKVPFIKVEFMGEQDGGGYWFLVLAPGHEPIRWNYNKDIRFRVGRWYVEIGPLRVDDHEVARKIKNNGLSDIALRRIIYDAPGRPLGVAIRMQKM